MVGRTGVCLLALAALGGCFSEIGPSSGVGSRSGEDVPDGPGPSDAGNLPGGEDGDGGVQVRPCEDADEQLVAPDGTCYFTWKLQLFSWFAALERCESLDAHLADVGSYAENSRLYGLADRTMATYPDFWLGGSDRALEGEWRWTDGKKALYKNWNIAQPANDNGFDDCMVLETIDSTGEWSARQCNSLYSAICERAP